MTSKTLPTPSAGAGDIAKYVVALLLVAAGLFAFYWFDGQWPTGVRALAVVAGMSRTSFTSLFRQLVGQTPADYLSDWRIGLAQTGLARGSSIKQLTSELGYANPSALSRAFAAKVGHSPREWLRGALPPAPPAPPLR